MPPLILAHTIAMAVAAALFTAVMVVVRRRKFKWLLWHKYLAVAGVISMVAGFGFIYSFKNQWEVPHFHSLHSRLGLAAISLMLIAPVLGYAMIHGFRSWRWPHRIIGGIAVLLFLITLFGKALHLN